MECLKNVLNVPGQGELYMLWTRSMNARISPDALRHGSNFEVLAILRELVVLRLPHVHFCFTSRDVLSTDSSGPSLLRRTLWFS